MDGAPKVMEAKVRQGKVRSIPGLRIETLGHQLSFVDRAKNNLRILRCAQDDTVFVDEGIIVSISEAASGGYARVPVA